MRKMVTGHEGPWSVGDSPCWPARWRMLYNGRAISNDTFEFFRERKDAETEAALRNARWANDRNLAELAATSGD